MRTNRRALLVALVSAAVALAGCEHRESRRWIYEFRTMSIARQLTDRLALYQQQCGGYPANLTALRPPESQTPTDCHRAGLVADPVLLRVVFDGPTQYRWNYQPVGEPMSHGGLVVYPHFQLTSNGVRRATWSEVWVSDEGIIRLGNPPGPDSPPASPQPPRSVATRP